MVVDDFLKRPVQSALVALGVRILIYALLLGALAAWMLWGAVVYDDVFYDETGPVEVLQTVFALSTALVFLISARINPRRGPCSILLSGGLFCISVRESDYLLDVLVMRNAWKVIVVLILVAMVLYALRHIGAAYRSVLEFINRPSFGILMCGMLVLAVFSRLFGYGPFWKAIMDHESYRTVKTIVEEGVEQMGYFLLLISSCEYLHDARLQQKPVPKLTE